MPTGSKRVSLDLTGGPGVDAQAAALKARTGRGI
jgi:hypothetical protein